MTLFIPNGIQRISVSSPPRRIQTGNKTDKKNKRENKNEKKQRGAKNINRLTAKTRGQNIHAEIRHLTQYKSKNRTEQTSQQTNHQRLRQKQFINIRFTRTKRFHNTDLTRSLKQRNRQCIKGAE